MWEPRYAAARFAIDDLVTNWNKAVEEGYFSAHLYEGIEPVPADMTGFFRPQLQAVLGKHYHSQSKKALPAISVGLIGAVGLLRFATIRALVCQEADDLSQKTLRQRVVKRVKDLLQPGQAAIFDGEFSPDELLDAEMGEFVVRGANNFAAPRNSLPASKGRGRPPEYGEIVRPLARTYKEKEIAATPCDATACWKVGKRTVKALLWNNRTLAGQQAWGQIPTLCDNRRSQVQAASGSGHHAFGDGLCSMVPVLGSLAD